MCRGFDSRIRLPLSEESTKMQYFSNYYKWCQKLEKFAICGRTLQEWVSDIRKDQDIFSEADAELMYCLNSNWPSYKRLITTEKGLVGMAPDWVQREDRVCILLGSSLPVLLRPAGDHYILVGPCYIHGIMFGEAMSPLDEGKVQLENFATH